MIHANTPEARDRARSPRPMAGLRRLSRACVVAVAASFGLGVLSDANAQQSTGSAPGDMVGAPTQGMGSMMRPDMAPPQGVIGAMSPKAGVIMPSLQYMRMRMNDNRDGTTDVSTAEVLSQYPVAPLNMDVDMLMAGLMYGISDDISVMAMIPYVWKSMDHVTRTRVDFTTKSEGVGDLRLIGGFDVYKSGGHTINLSAGLSFPTGSTDERDDTPMGPNQLLPYPMQTGSGTIDVLPGITYTGRSEDWSWGGQFNAILRLGENDDNYTLGNVYGASAWGARRWVNWLSSSARLIGEVVEDIDGADPRLNPAMAPTADPNLRAGDFLSLGLGLNFLVPSGSAKGLRLSVEGIIPVVQDLDGPQLKREYTILIGLRKAF
ncbi:MAG: hypothetical protein BMS9Abin01_0688 [Gammaproteobacteria bacterium]|nr:MAG: hypothetical protein BMS9Abin01_0688 [Gammaproteobacteria bacterium]